MEYLVTRDYSGGPNAADRINDVVTVVQTGYSAQPTQTPEAFIVADIDAYGRIFLQVRVPAGGNSGQLTYDATEFECDGAPPADPAP
jgi:hypothetical protein